MMTTQEIQNRVIDVVSKQLELSERVKGEIKPESRFSEDLGCDSLDLAEIMMDLEDDFDIMVSDDDAKAIKTVSEAVAYIEKQVGG